MTYLVYGWAWLQMLDKLNFNFVHVVFRLQCLLNPNRIAELRQERDGLRKKVEGLVEKYGKEHITNFGELCKSVKSI